MPRRSSEAPAVRRLRAIGAAVIAEPVLDLGRTPPSASADHRKLQLPIVDMRSPLAAAQLNDACTRVGFQCVVGHGIDREAADAARACEEFIAGAQTGSFCAVRKPTLGYGTGLQAKGHLDSESYSTEHGEYGVDGREDFVVMHPEAAARKAAGDPYYTAPHARIWFGDCANRFPTNDGGRMRRALERHYLELEALSQRLLSLCGEVLAGDGQHFAEVTSKHTTNLVIAFHEDRTPDPDTPSVSAHSDSALFTLIYYGSHGAEGLEVQDQATGNWHRVASEDIPPGALVFNIGDGMRRLSNNRFLSTPHRVIDTAPVPGTQQDERGRLAMCYFFAPNYDVPLVPVGTDGNGAPESLLGGLTTHGYHVAPAAERAEFDRWCLSRSINARTPYHIS